nr:ribonuclease H-like domain-containing protein [Tanacetum cinerariifolium]
MAITSSSFSSDNEVPSYSKACFKAYAQLHSQYDKLTNEFCKSQFDVLSYQAGLEFVEAGLVVYKQNESILEENIKLLNIEVQARDIALVTLRQKLNHAEQERDDLKLKLDKFQSSSKNLTELLSSQTNDKHGLAYFSSESDSESLSPSSLSDRLQPSGGYHPVEAPILDATLKPTNPKSNSSSKRKNRKTCFVCRSVDQLIKDCDFHAKKKAQPKPRNYAHKGNNKQNASFTHKQPLKHMVPAAVLTQSKPVSITAVRLVCAAVPKIMASVVSAAKGKKGKWGNPQYALKDKGVIDSGCSRYMTGNMSYLSDFEEQIGGYVAFRGNPKGGKISGKGKIKTGKGKIKTGTLDFEDVYFVKELKFNLLSVSQMCDKKNKVLFTDTECLVLSPDFKLPNESQVLLRVPRENNMYNVNLKNIVTFGDLTCLFAKAAIDESNLWHRRMGHINFKTINKLVKEKAGEEVTQQYMLFLVWSFGSSNPQNKDEDVSFDGKEHEVDTKKPEFVVNVSPCSSDQSEKQDDKTKKKAKGKIPIAGQNSSNSTNPFSAAEMEDITYFDHENVGAETDFNNLKTSITVSPIPTTRTHKDHPVSQIIGDLSSTTQTRSMTRMIKDQGGLSQIFNDDFHTCMFVCFLSQKEPKRVHQALKDPS